MRITFYRLFNSLGFLYLLFITTTWPPSSDEVELFERFNFQINSKSLNPLDYTSSLECPYRATLGQGTGYPRRSACRRSFPRAPKLLSGGSSGGAAIGLKLLGLSAHGLQITIEAPRSKLTRNLRFFYNYFFCVRLPRSKLTGNALTEFELAYYSFFATEWHLNSRGCLKSIKMNIKP